MNIIKIGILGVLIAVMASFLKEKRPSMALLLVVAGGIFFLTLCMDSMRTVLVFLGECREKLGEGGTYLELLFKITGIAYVSQFCGGMCADAGYATLGKQIEIAGKFCILLEGIPIFLLLLNTVEGFFV